MNRRTRKNKHRPNHKRPQPAGWEAAVKKLLKPEHVERVSDTVVKIHWPPCPDFDIEEDEIVHITIPPEALVKSTVPLYAGSITIKADSYEERIDHSIEGLREEETLLAEDAVVPRFLFTFFACEIVAKAIVSKYRHRGTNKKALVGKWSTKDINSALNYLNIDFDQLAVNSLFSEEKVVASEMSARQLRDNVVHRMKSVHRNTVRNRYDFLMTTMQEFLDVVQEWRKQATD